jgi:F-type H+-transporting ATPase subunit c
MKLIKSAFLALGLLLVTEGSVFAQEGPGAPTVAPPAPTVAPLAPTVAPLSLKSIGAGIVIVGAAMGIGLLGRATVESMARQPEIASNIQTAMIIAAALIEGVTFFALLVVLIVT